MTPKSESAARSAPGVRLAIGSLVTLLAAGCSGLTAPPPEPPTLESQLVARGLRPEEIVRPDRIDDEMRSWLQEILGERRAPSDRLERILDAMQSDWGLALTYDVGATGTAMEVFRSRIYNCLSFSHLFIALAREIGLEAYYMTVDEIQRYEREGDLVVVSSHVTSGFGSGPDRQVLEFAVGPAADYDSAQRISDLMALALHYTNRGAESLRDGDVEDAIGWLETAVRIEPGLAHAWTNLGVARRRSGDLEGAETAYRRAIFIEPRTLSAHHNLAGLLRLRGEDDAAREILAILDEVRHRDPYIYLALGDDSMDQGRLEDAERFYRRALRYARRDPEVRAALGLWALAAGDEERARIWLRRARESDAESERTAELSRALDASTDDGGV